MIIQQIVTMDIRMSSLRLLTHSIITGVGTMSKEKIKRKTIVLYILGTKVFLGYVTLKNPFGKLIQS